MGDSLLYDGSGLFTCSALHGEALEFFCSVGHTSAVSPLIVAEDILHCIYSELAFNAYFSKTERLAFSKINDLSHLFTLDNEAFDRKSTRQVRYYAVSLNTDKSERTVNANDILRAFVKNTTDYIVILFRHERMCMLAFAVKLNGFITIYSDWFGYDGYCDISARVDLGNMTLQNSDEFFYDFAYMAARHYYTHPISRDYAHAEWSTATYFIDEDEIFARKSWKEVATEIVFSHIFEYGDDFTNLPLADEYQNDILEDSEYDLLIMELELEESLAAQEFNFAADDDDENFDDEDDFYDDSERIDASSIPPEIMRDPVKLLEWLSKVKDNDANEEMW